MRLFGLIRDILLVALCSISLGKVFGQDLLFQNDSILNLSISGNLQPVLSDTSIFPVYLPQLLRFSDPVSGTEKELSIELKARGNFRRLKANCTNLPLMLRFPDAKDTKGTVFHKQRKLKMVLPCQGTTYVFREWLAYKIYNLINPVYSFKTRIVRLEFLDEDSGLEENEVLGFIIENEKRLAVRNKMKLDEDIVVAQAIDKQTYLKMALFQLLIGNTDWSIPFLHNMKVMRKDSTATPVVIPYDFDHAGLVNAPYAIPPPPLDLESVRQRMYRGYCLDDVNEIEGVIEHFQNLKNDIYELVQNVKWVNPTEITEMIAYLDLFYNIVQDPKNREAVLMAPCKLDSKSNIEIMGLGY